MDDMTYWIDPDTGQPVGGTKGKVVVPSGVKVITEAQFNKAVAATQQTAADVQAGIAATDAADASHLFKQAQAAGMDEQAALILARMRHPEFVAP